MCRNNPFKMSIRGGLKLSNLSEIQECLNLIQGGAFSKKQERVALQEERKEAILLQEITGFK